MGEGFPAVFFLNRYILAPLVAAGVILSAASYGFAQDYKGLIEQKKEEGVSSPSKGGYQGLIAPPPSGANNSSSAPQDLPKGYTGLIPGKTPDSSAPQETPSSRKPEMTPRPGWSAERPVQTGEDLRWRTMSYSVDKDSNGIPDEVEAAMKSLLKGKEIKLSGRRRSHGMLSGEYSSKKIIDSIMAQVKDKKSSEEQRKKAARDGYNRLLSLSAMFQRKGAVPASISHKIGIPEVRIKESREESEKALIRLNAALKELKEYQ